MEKYKALNSRKVYLIFDASMMSDEITEQSKKYFKVSERDLDGYLAYLYNNELYFENPHKRGTKKCIAVESKRLRTST